MSLYIYLYEKKLKWYLGREDDQDLSAQILETDHQILSKVCQKAKLKWETVNYYLNKEFLNHRIFAKVTPAS